MLFNHSLNKRIPVPIQTGWLLAVSTHLDNWSHGWSPHLIPLYCCKQCNYISHDYTVIIICILLAFINTFKVVCRPDRTGVCWFIVCIKIWYVNIYTYATIINKLLAYLLYLLTWYNKIMYQKIILHCWR
jgi:hypothetical protein